VNLSAIYNIIVVSLIVVLHGNKRPNALFLFGRAKGHFKNDQLALLLVQIAIKSLIFLDNTPIE